jgi:ZIP family zinc transporter
MSAIENLFVSIAGNDPVIQGLVAGFVIAFLNLLGAVLVFVWRNPSQRSMDAALGGAAGVMLAASFTSLILPGIEAEPYGGIFPVMIGLILGVGVLDRADAWVPHVHVLITGRLRENGAANASVADGGLNETRVASVLLFIWPSHSTICRKDWLLVSGSGPATLPMRSR